MKTNKLYIWMGAASTLLLLLIAIQFMWLHNASEAEKRETRMHVMRALERTDAELKVTASCFEMYSKAYFGAHDGFYMIRQKWDSTGFIGKPDTLDMYFDTEGYYPDSVVYKQKSLQDQYPLTAQIHLMFNVQFNSANGDDSLRRVHYEKMTGKRFRDIISNTTRIDSVLSMKLADSLLKKNLQDENIKAGYGFGFIEVKNNKVDYSKRVASATALLQTPFSINFFSDNKFMRQYKLALVFTGNASIYPVNYLLLLSIVIIVLLTISFYSFLRLYIKQSRLSEMKSDFINNLTHEFNTPMANISLAIETLGDDSLVSNSKAGKILGIISTESARLRDNIECALQVATLDKGNLRLRKEQVDLVATIGIAISAYQLQCEQLGGKIAFIHPAHIIIWGDETHLLNCVCNLLDNAIKYRQAAPEISITLEEKESSIVLTIADNGKGMSNETQKHIFEKFYRAHEGDVHNTKGFGLGLSYVKGIVAAHKGKISVWSKPGAGAKFTIELPKN